MRVCAAFLLWAVMTWASTCIRVLAVCTVATHWGSHAGPQEPRAEQRALIFWHIAVINGTEPKLQEVLDRQLAALEGSGLLPRCFVSIGLVGDPSAKTPTLNRILERPNVRVVARASPPAYECVTTRPLWRLAVQEVEKCRARRKCAEDKLPPVLYMHSRGITRSAQEYAPSSDWTRMMEYMLIEHWRTSVALIARHKVRTTGCELWIHPLAPAWHYSGNFWWASLPHIALLPDPELLTNWSRRLDEKLVRFDCGESWVLRDMGARPQHVVLHYTGWHPGERGRINSYEDMYPRRMYDCPRRTSSEEFPVIPSVVPCAPIEQCTGAGCGDEIVMRRTGGVSMAEFLHVKNLTGFPWIVEIPSSEAPLGFVHTTTGWPAPMKLSMFLTIALTVFLWCRKR